MYQVKVWFATSREPRTIGAFETEALALREARSYLSDARGVWIIYPDGREVAVRP